MFYLMCYQCHRSMGFDFFVYDPFIILSDGVLNHLFEILRI